jgi:hypothetical protein
MMAAEEEEVPEVPEPEDIIVVSSVGPLLALARTLHRRQQQQQRVTTNAATTEITETTQPVAVVFVGNGGAAQV